MKRRSKLDKVKIGLEVEINELNYDLETELDRDIWALKSEHCGTELISKPAEGPRQIRKLVKSIKKMGKHKPGFQNAGTHIHIDFFSYEHVKMSDLVRLEAKKVLGVYDNPIGNGKKYFWINADGNLWAKPTDYVKAFGVSKEDSPASVFCSEVHSRILRNVKRFLTLGIRFAPVLFAIQHPDRWFNKYSHTMEHWDEDVLNLQSSIAAICMHPSLLQNHRRTMFNPLSFEKFGTMEVRMIKASLDWRDVMMHINLFARIANLAKSDNPLPTRGKKLSQSLLILLDACEIHGKSRRTIIDAFNKNKKIKSFNCICFNYDCQRNSSSKGYGDFGLSRAICNPCVQSWFHCALCGLREPRDDYEYSMHKVLDDGRDVCQGCWRHRESKLSMETASSRWLLGTLVGSGFDEDGEQIILRNANERIVLT